MFPLGWFVDDVFPNDYWPHGEGARGGRGRGVGGRQGYQMWLADQAAAEVLLAQQKVVAALTLDRLLRMRSEWLGLYAMEQKRKAEGAMYSVLLSEL